VQLALPALHCLLLVLVLEGLQVLPEQREQQQPGEASAAAAAAAQAGRFPALPVLLVLTRLLPQRQLQQQANPERCCPHFAAYWLLLLLLLLALLLQVQQSLRQLQLPLPPALAAAAAAGVAVLLQGAAGLLLQQHCSSLRQSHPYTSAAAGDEWVLPVAAAPAAGRGLASCPYSHPYHQTYH
jgi:hypothetical protein